VRAREHPPGRGLFSRLAAVIPSPNIRLPCNNNLPPKTRPSSPHSNCDSAKGLPIFSCSRYWMERESMKTSLT
jgi:hypothetical protein